MRVISGAAKGRRLNAPPGQNTRPITDRAKEGIFNMLMSLGGLEDAVVVDLFAGSGSFGIECLSRGAAEVVFVERDRNAVAVIEANLEMLDMADRARIVQGAVVAALSGLPDADLAFCDPPYAQDPWPELLGALRARMVVGHAEQPIELPQGWRELRRRDYGKSRIVIAEADSIQI